MKQALEELIRISKFAGERFDLVQAGGGNSSVKLNDGTMIIKSSGVALSEVDTTKGFSLVNYKSLSQILSNDKIFDEPDKKKREFLSSSKIKEATLNEYKPSIEVLLHSITKKYTLHTHPISANIVLIRKDWDIILKKLFSPQTIALIPYVTPGIDLAIQLDNELKKIVETPKIIFLQNHGLLIHSDDIQEVIRLTDETVIKIEQFLGIDLSKFRATNKISNLLGREDLVSYYSQDQIIDEALKTKKEKFFLPPFCPDKLVYCGISAIELKSEDDLVSLEKYREKYHDDPKVIILNNGVYFVGKNLKKAKETEEVFKFHLLVLNQAHSQPITFLSDLELSYLSNWDSEKYRQNL